MKNFWSLDPDWKARLKHSFLTVSLTLFFCGAHPAYAVNINFVGSMGLGNAAVSSTSGTIVSSRSLPYGGGLLFGFRMLPKLSMELGFLYMPRAFQEKFSDDTSNGITFTTVQIPLLLRFQILNSLSIGVGGYFSHGIGNVTVVGPASSTSHSYANANFGADDYGAIASLGIKFPLILKLSLILDGRYLYGFQNVNKVNGVSTYFRDLQALVGVRLGM